MAIEFQEAFTFSYNSDTALYIGGDQINIKRPRSPELLNEYFKRHGVPLLYLPVFVPDKTHLEDLFKFVRRTEHIKWVNIGAPYKAESAKFVDMFEDSSRITRCVDFVKKDSTGLQGYAHNGDAFYDWFTQIANEIFEDILVLGAGGAGAEITSSIATRSLSKLCVYDLDVEKARRVTSKLNDELHSEIIVVDNNNIASSMTSSHVIINATGVGKEPKTEEIPVSADSVSPDSVIVDINYLFSGRKTNRFLDEAHAKGAKIYNGEGMMIMTNLFILRKMIGSTEYYEDLHKLAEEIGVL